MAMKNNLPFKVGEDIELKSFLTGYRGAWFRCKINAIKRGKRGDLKYKVEYHDFPEEVIKWSKPYEAPRKSSKEELMFRPPFPHFHKESERPKETPNSTDVKIIVNDSWRVGDLVDLWFDECFWSGTIKRLFGINSVEVELSEPPIGEGGLYTGKLHNLRPSLDWSLETGWTVPISIVNGESRHCARVTTIKTVSESASGSSSESLRFPGKNTKQKKKNYVTISSSSSSEANHNDYNDDAAKDCTPSSSSKEDAKKHGEIDSLVMGLEELMCKLRWIKGLSEYGFKWSNDMKPSWKHLPDDDQ